MAKQHSFDTVKEWMKSCSNWGKWGPDDELGTLNYITAEMVRAAAKLVRRGRIISLAIPFDSQGPQAGKFERFNPIHLMTRHGADAYAGALDHRPIHSADDVIIMPLQCATQWDSLAHIFYDGKMYNGYDMRLVSSFGAKKNGIANCKDKVVGRGVLLDIPRYQKVEWLEPGTPIYPEDLEGCARQQGVTVGCGDILLVRTGQIAQVRKRGSWGDYAGGSAPGLSVANAPWLYQSQVAAVATDTWGIEVLPNDTQGAYQPLHLIMIVHAGLLVGEIFDLEELARDCAQDGCYEFMFVAPPLPVTGAVGSPINPQAIK